MNKIQRLLHPGHQLLRRSDLVNFRFVTNHPAQATALISNSSKSYSAQVKTSKTGLQIGHNVPSKMKFIAHDTDIGPESLMVQEGDTPQYNPDQEVLIKIEATAANRADLMQSQGKYPPPKGVTNVIGLECSGYLVDPQTNEITDRKVMALLSGGGYAQFAKVNKDHIMNVPAGMSFAEAASIPEAWTTAYQLLYRIAKVKEDETVLIHAAASGVGTSLIQLCEHMGASSISICSNQGKVEYCKDLGSFDGICYKKIPKFNERVDAITNNEGVDVILDPVMGSFFNANMECLGMDSRWVIYGFMGGIKVEQANMMKLLNKRGSILTTTLRNRSDEYKRNLIKDMEHDCYPAFESGDLKVIIDSTFELSNAKEALLYMGQNLNMGKIVLENDL